MMVEGMDANLNWPMRSFCFFKGRNSASYRRPYDGCPAWGPDGRHIVFSRTVGRQVQIYSMLADGSQLKQLTFSGSNEKPAWTH